MKLAEISIQIKQVVFELCKKNPEFAQVLFTDLDNPTMRNVSLSRNKGDNIIIVFEMDNPSSRGLDVFHCTLVFNNQQFKYTRKIDGLTDESLYQYYSAAMINGKTAFYQTEIAIRKNGQFSRNVQSNNSFEIYNESSQLYAEQNEVFLTCSSATVAQKNLKEKKLTMKVTNKHSLWILRKLGLTLDMVEKNRSIQTEIWPLANNNLVQLQNPESINYDDEMDRYINIPTLSVGTNYHPNFDHLIPGKMYCYQSPEETTLAQRYLDKKIDITQLQDEASALLNKYLQEKNYLEY